MVGASTVGRADCRGIAACADPASLLGLAGARSGLFFRFGLLEWGVFER